MYIDTEDIERQIIRSFKKGFLKIIDHRGNRLIINNGVFTYNESIVVKDKCKIVFLF